MGRKVIDLVRRSYPSLDEGARVAEAARLMARQDLGSVVVTREGRAVGLFTERDLLKRVVAVGRDPESLALGDVCTRNLVSIPHDSNCREAVRSMQVNRCRRLLVYRGEHYVGLVKLSDLAHAMANRGSGSDILLNAMGAVTAALAIGVVAVLLFQLPEVFEMAGQLSPR
jgi:signal-transduction protein with cAMP-binding, CBS, and nucleotidyltransferase domain